jgi:hypothetical protein
MNNFFKLQPSLIEDKCSEMLDKLVDSKKIFLLIKIKGNLSAPWSDELTFPILKLGAECDAIIMTEHMKSLLKGGKCPDDLKIGKLYCYATTLIKMIKQSIGP